MAKTKGGQREKTKTSRNASSKSSQSTPSSKCSSDRQTTQTGRMRNRKKSGAELYKSRHNIGKRSAAGRVASYRETEVALLFPDGFFRPVVKMEAHNSDKDGGASVDNVQTPSKADHLTVETKDKQTSSESSEGIRKPLTKSSSESPSSKSKVLHKSASKSVVNKKNSPKSTSGERKSVEKKQKAVKEASASRETTKSSKGKLLKGSAKSMKVLQSEGSPKKHLDSESSLLQVSSPKDASNDNKSGQATKRINNKSQNKNTVQKTKSANQSSEVSSPKVSKYFGLQPRAPRIKRTACLNAGAIMSAMYRDTPVMKKPKIDASSVHTPAEKSAPKQSTKKPENDKPQTQKVTSPKKIESKKNFKKTSHLDINKKVKVKMKAKEKLKSQPNLIKKGKKVKVEENSEEESEKEEEHIPLWPPPRRMASLNAQAILAACNEERVKRPRAEGTSKVTRRQSAKKQKQVQADETSEKCGEEYREPSPEKTATSKADDEMESEPVVKSSEENTPVTQSQPVTSSSSEQAASSKTRDRQEPVTEPASKPNLPNQSPDVQILEVKPPSYSGASVSRMNVGGYTSHSMPHARQTQGPVAFMPSSSSSFSYAAPSGHSSHGNQARYPGVPVQQPIPPQAPSGYALQHQAQRAYQSTHMAYPTQAPQHGQSILPSVAQHSAQKMYGQGQHLGHSPYSGHPQARHRAPLASQSQASFQQQQQQQQQPQQHQQQQQQQQTHHHPHHHQLAPYQPSLTPHSSQNTIVQHSQSYHHHNYPIQQSHQAPSMPVLGHHAMSSGTIYPGGVPMSVTKPKMEPRCSTPAQRFQAIGPKPEKPLMSYPTLPGSQGQQGSALNHPHGPSPMGNTCTYPYPHSNHGNTQSDQCQSYMMSSMPVDNSATCTMMSFRHFGSAFTLHSYDEQQQEHTTFGFYQPAGPLIQTMPHDPCCIPEHMAMLVPRPQVKVLVHNTGSYPATNPYAALPDSSQPPIIPTKGSGTHHMRSNSSELKEKSQNTASPTKRTKTAKELDHDKCEVMADARKENDDGKVFTTLEVAKKQLKNIDGRELLAQRTKLSSDPLLLQPIISERSSNSVHSEDKTNTEEPSVPVSQASMKTTDNVVSSAQTQQYDKPTDKLVGHGKDTQKGTTNNASEMKESESAEQKRSEDQTTKSSKLVTATTTSFTSVAEKVLSSVSSLSTVSVALASTTSVIDTQAKISSDLMTVVTCSVSSNTEPKRIMTVNTPTSSSSASSPITTETKLSTTGSTSAATNTTSFESSNTPVKTPVIKRAKPVKTGKKVGVSVPTTTSGPVTATAVVTVTTATITTKSTLTQVKEASRKRKNSTSIDATAVKVSAVTSKDNGDEKSTDTLNKIKIKTPSKTTTSKKGKCTGVSAGESTVPCSGGTTSADSQSTVAAKPLSTVIPPNTGNAAPTASSSLASSTSSVNTSLSVSQVRAMPFSTLQSVVDQSSTSKTADGSRTASITGGTVMSVVTGVTSPAVGKPAMVTPSSAITPLFVSSTQKPMPDGKAGPTTAILPQGTVLLSNTGALNQPILMSAINNPAQIAPGQLPLVSVPAGQVVMPVFLPAKSLAPTTGAVAMTSVSTSTLTTTTASGTAVSQMKMPLLQNSFSVAQANIALSGMMPPVFLSIPQPNTMGQTFLHLGGIKPNLQQIQLPVVSHQQIMVTQASQDIRTVATSKDEATLSAQGKKPSTSSQAQTEKNEVKEVTPKARKKKTPKVGTAENKTKDKVKTPAKKKAKKTKVESTTEVTSSAAKSLPETSLSALQATVKHHPVSTFGLPSIPQVVCSVSQVRSSTAPLLGCSSQSVHSQGKTNISHCVDPVKSQTPLEMLQSVALGGQKVVSQAKDGLKLTESVDGSKPPMNIAMQPGHKIDENGALDLVMLSGLVSKASDSKTRTLKTPATKAKASTQLKAPSGQSLATSIQTSPRPAAMLHSPPSVTHGVAVYSPGYTPTVLPVIDKTCSSAPAAAYEDLIQDLSLPRQQQTSTPPKSTVTKDGINKSDPATPIDLSKNKNKMATKSTKSEGSKKCKKSKQATSSKQTTGKSKSSSPPALYTLSNISSSLPPSGFQYIAGIQIPVINRIPSLISPGTKVATTGATTNDMSKSQCVENQIVSSTTSSKAVGHEKVKGSDKSLSVSDVDKQLEKTLPAKGMMSRGFQLKEVVERLHQANKELSDNSDRSDGECSPNKQKKLVSSSVQPLTTDKKITKNESQQLQAEKSKQDEQSKVNLKKSDSYQKDVGIKSTGDGDDYDEDDDDDDEDALFIDMDCDPADNKPGVSCSIENESFVSVTENVFARSDQNITDQRNQAPNAAKEPSPGSETSQAVTCRVLGSEHHSEMYNERDKSQNMAQKRYFDEKRDESPKPSVAIGEMQKPCSNSSVCNSSATDCIDSSEAAEPGGWSHHVDSCSTNSVEPQSRAVKINSTSVVRPSNDDPEMQQSIKDEDVTCSQDKDIAATECIQDVAKSTAEQVTRSANISLEKNSHVDNDVLQAEDADQHRSVTSVGMTSGQRCSGETVSEKLTMNVVDKNISTSSVVDPSTLNSNTEKCRDCGPGSGTTADSTSVTEVVKDNNKAVTETNKEDRNKENSTRKLADEAKTNNGTHSLEDERRLQSTEKPQLGVDVRKENTKSQSQNDNTGEKCTTAVSPNTDPVTDGTASGIASDDTITEPQKDVLLLDNTLKQLQTEDQCVDCPVRCLSSGDNRNNVIATQLTDSGRVGDFILKSTESDSSVAVSSEAAGSTREGDTREETHKNSSETGTEVTNTPEDLPGEVRAVSNDTTECTKEEVTLDNTAIDSAKKDTSAASTATESPNDDETFSNPASEISDEKQVNSTEMESSSAGLLQDSMSVDVTTISTGQEDTTRLSDDSKVTSPVTELENTRTEIAESSSEYSKDKKNISDRHDVTVSNKVVCDLAVSGEQQSMESHSGQDFNKLHTQEHFLKGENCQRDKTSTHDKASEVVDVSTKITDVLREGSAVIVSVDSALKESPAQAHHITEIENVMNTTETKAELKYPKSENNTAAENTLTETVVNNKSNVVKNEMLTGPEVTHRELSLVEEQASMSQLVASDTKEYTTGDDESSQDTKAKEIIMAIDSLVSSSSFVEECKHMRNDAPTEVTMADCEDESTKAVENGEEMNHSGQNIQCGGADSSDKCELKQEDNHFLNENGKDIGSENRETAELAPDTVLNVSFRNGNLDCAAGLVEGVTDEVSHAGLQQKTIERPVIYPGKCTKLDVMEELNIICEENDPGVGCLTGGSMCCPHSVNNISVACEDTDISVCVAGIRRAHSLSPNLHPQGSNSKRITLGIGEQCVEAAKGPNTKKSPEDNPRRTSPRAQGCLTSKKEDSASVVDDNPRRAQCSGKRKEDTSNISPPAKRVLISPKRKDDKKAGSELKKLSPSARKKEEKLYKPWRWEGEPEVKPVYTQVDGPPVPMTCYPAIRHDDGDLIRVRDCVLVKSGPRKSDIPYVAKIGALFEDPETREVMMSVLWFYRAEHTETERLPRYIDNEIFASRHRDVIPAVCIDDKCYVLTFNEFCRYHGEQTRIQQCLPPRPNIVPRLDSSELTRTLGHIPPLTASNETVFLCRRVYDVKLKRILKNPQVHTASHSGQ